MSNSPQGIEIFDRRQVRRNRLRASQADGTHNFLFNWVTDQLTSRFQDIKYDFPNTLLISGRADLEREEALIEAGGIRNLVTMDLTSTAQKTNKMHIQADEELLPFAPHSFDCVLCPLNLHTINDLPGSLIQIRHSLKPDGLFLGALLGGETLYELRDSFAHAEMALRGGITPRVAPFADKQQIGSLMQRAGYALPVVDSEILTVTYNSSFDLMKDLRFMGESNSIAARRNTLTGRDIMAHTDSYYKDHFSEEDGRIVASFEVIFMIGWAPHKTQQQPLKPGSAKIKLADALQTTEIGTGEPTQ